MATKKAAAKKAAPAVKKITKPTSTTGYDQFVLDLSMRADTIKYWTEDAFGKSEPQVMTIGKDGVMLYVHKQLVELGFGNYVDTVYVQDGRSKILVAGPVTSLTRKKNVWQITELHTQRVFKIEFFKTIKLYNTL